MFRHVVMFQWNEGVDSTQIDGVAAALDRLPAAIPEILTYAHGADAGVNAGNFDYAVVADFATVDDYLVYRDHPQHQAFIAEHIAGRVASRAALQYAVD